MEHSIYLYSAVIGCTFVGGQVILQVLGASDRWRNAGLLAGSAFLSLFGLLGLGLMHHDTPVALRIGGTVLAGAGGAFCALWMSGAIDRQ